jgi:hypothetical protein
LPTERFDLSQWSRARVNIDYHLSFDGSVYSVPYILIGELVEVRSTVTTVEIFHKSQRVASHLRARRERTWRRYRKPTSWILERTSRSGSVSLPGTAAIIAERAALETVFISNKWCL